MNKDNEASISFKKVMLIVIAAILLLSAMVLTFVSVKLGGIKIIGADRVQIAQNDEVLSGNVNDANDTNDESSLQSDLDIYTTESEKFEEKAIFDIKTFATATKKNKEKCLRQEKMYAEAIEYLTGEKIEKFYMIHLPKGKKGKIIDLEENK